MDPKIQFLFFLAGAACFGLATFYKNNPPWMSVAKYQSAGLFFFIFPFMWSAATAGW